jgi:hypothetical protein
MQRVKQKSALTAILTPLRANSRDNKRLQASTKLKTTMIKSENGVSNWLEILPKRHG